MSVLESDLEFTDILHTNIVNAVALWWLMLSAGDCYIGNERLDVAKGMVAYGEGPRNTGY